MAGTVLTKEGYAKMRAQLQEMKRKDRPQIIEAIKEARAHGDLSENAEYHAAKEKQVEIENKIMELETKVSTARVIDVSNIKKDEIVMGATVILKDLDDKIEETFYLTSSDEADPLAGQISTVSPIGKGLLNKKVGDKVKIKTPGGQVRYQVLKISYR